MLNVISSIGESLIIYYIVFYKVDKSKKTFGFFGTILNMFLLMLMNNFSVNSFVKIIFYWLLSTIVFSLIYRKRFGRILFQILLSILFISVCDVIALSLFECISKMDVEVQMQNVKGVRWILTLFSKSLCFGIATIICKFFDFEKRNNNNRDYLIGIPFIVYQVGIFSLGYTLLATPNSSSILYVALTILILISSFVNLFLTKRHLDIKEIEHDNNLSVYQIESQYKYYKLKKEEFVKIQQIRHDLKNHLLILSGIQGKQNEYVEKLIDEIDSYYARYNTGNEIIDILLTEKARLADEKGVKFAACISINMLEFISNIDLVTILGNVLDNALEACDTEIIRQKYIKINGKEIEKFYVIICENSNLKEVREKDGNFITNKPIKEMHGLGISNIKNTVKKYGGSVYIVHNDDIFNVKILFPLH